MSIKYPNIKVNLYDCDSNIFSIVGLVSKELRKNKVHFDEIILFQNETKQGDYNNALQVCMKWVNIGFTSRDEENDVYCLDCGESFETCQCEDDYEECFDCGERLDECTCDDEDYD